MIFIYDKENDLKIVAKFNKKSLANFYMAEDKKLVSVDFFKEKNKIDARRVSVFFEEDVKLWFNPLEGYEYLLRAVLKNSTDIKFPKQASRIETNLSGMPKSFTIQSGIIDTLISKI